MKSESISARVRVADRAILLAALRGPAALRPEPGQMLWAGRKASITGYRRRREGRSLYVLKDAPGLWPEEWIQPL